MLFWSHSSLPRTRNFQQKVTREELSAHQIKKEHFGVLFCGQRGIRTGGSETSWLSVESQRRRASMNATKGAFSATAGKEFVSVDEQTTRRLVSYCKMGFERAEVS